MRRAHKQASEDNLRSKGSNYSTILSKRTPPPTSPSVRLTTSNTTPPHICSFIWFLLLICCGCLSFPFLRDSEHKRPRRQNFTAILLCCRHRRRLGPAPFCLPSRGLPSFPNSCRGRPCQAQNRHRPIAGQLSVWMRTAC